MGRSDGSRGPAPVALPATSSVALRGLMSSRPFRRIVLASATSSLGDWIGFLAIIALTVDILGPTRAAAFAVSGVMTARIVPSLLLAPVAGVFVDRWDRKRVLILTYLGRAVVMALIPFTQEILSLVLATLLLEALSALFAPAKDAVYPTLVRRDQLVSANQINLVATYGTLPIAGFIYAVLIVAAGRYAPDGSLLAVRPVALPIWFNAAAFVISALLIASIRIRRRGGPYRPAKEGIGAEFREGMRFVAGQPVIRALIGGVMVAATAAGVVISVGEFFAGILNAGPSGFGVLVAAVGTGMVLGIFAASPLSRRFPPERLFSPAILVAGLALILTAASPTIVVVFFPATLLGAAAGLVFIVGYTVLQRRSDDRIRGRTFGTFNAGVRIAIFSATVVVPFAIGLIGREQRIVVSGDGLVTTVYPYVFGGIRITLILTGVFMMLGGVLTWRVLVTALRSERVLLAERDVALANGETPPTDAAGVLGPARRGVFIAFEGGDGSGKSTQLRLLRDHIERLGLDVLVTREPGGTVIGERIRDILLDPASSALTDRAEALLYAAARAQHVAEVIEPALASGSIVLCDRFIDSSVVYQGAGRGLGEPRIEELNLWATEQIIADLIVLLDVEVEEGLRRAGAARGLDRLEAAGSVFHAAVRAAYRRRAAAEPHRYLLLDARQEVDVLHEQIVRNVAIVLEPVLGPAVVPG
jgi:dTMP kinase